MFQKIQVILMFIFMIYTGSSFVKDTFNTVETSSGKLLVVLFSPVLLILGCVKGLLIYLMHTLIPGCGIFLLVGGIYTSQYRYVAIGGVILILSIVFMKLSKKNENK